MGKLIKLTVYKRNATFKSGAEMVFNVDDIISPIRLNAAGKSYFTAKSKHSVDVVNYQVEEELADIKALSEFIVLLTVISRAGRVLTTPEEFIFDINKLNEISAIDTGAGFSNYEEGDPSPVEYIVEEDLNNIVEQATTTPSTPAQDANKVFSGPASGVDAIPSFRSLVLADLPANLFAAKVKNTVLAGPATGADAVPAFRELIGDDLPLEVVDDTGAFNIPNTDSAIAVTINGVIKYIQLLDYTAP